MVQQSVEKDTPEEHVKTHKKIVKKIMKRMIEKDHTLVILANEDADYAGLFF